MADPASQLTLSLGNMTHLLTPRVLTVVLVVTALASCGDDGDRAADSTSTSAGEPVLEVQEEWECIATPVELADGAGLVVLAKPLSEETPFAEEDPGGGSRVDVLATSMEVVEVLAGTGLVPEDQFVLSRRVEHRTVTADGVTEERLVSGEGFPGPPTDNGYVLGLVPEGGVWTTVAGAHGRVALDEAADTGRVLEPSPGDDGRLQSEYAGSTVADLKRDLAHPAGTSPCASEPEH